MNISDASGCKSLDITFDVAEANELILVTLVN